MLSLELTKFKMKSFVSNKNPSTKLGFLFVVGVLFLIGSLKTSLFPVIDRNEKFLPPPPHLEHFTFGYHELIADILWLRALQDFDYCEEKIDTLICRNNSWLFHILDTVTNLSPKFRPAHALGPLTLTVLVNDIEGASKLFDKAVKEFPSDWRILYRAFYQAYYEEKDFKKAAQLARRSADNGGPKWLYATAVGLFKEQDSSIQAREMYRELESLGLPDDVLKRAREKLNIK